MRMEAFSAAIIIRIALAPLVIIEPPNHEQEASWVDNHWIGLFITYTKFEPTRTDLLLIIATKSTL